MVMRCNEVKLREFPIYLISCGQTCFDGSHQSIRFMTLEQATTCIKSCASQMDARYGKTVFDEWAMISLAQNFSDCGKEFQPNNPL
jgi:hypothetical protein